MSTSRVEGPFAIGDGPIILVLLQTSYRAESYIGNLAPSPESGSRNAGLCKCLFALNPTVTLGA
jgi:hypothetical protein